MDNSKIADFLSQQTQWRLGRVEAKSTPFEQIWERHIRTARNILSGMLKFHGDILNEESFQNVLVEIENVINSRPLSVDNLSDPNSLQRMTLLTEVEDRLSTSKNIWKLGYLQSEVLALHSTLSMSSGNVGARSTIIPKSFNATNFRTKKCPKVSNAENINIFRLVRKFITPNLLEKYFFLILFHKL